ncbi:MULTISPECIES: hypothetical protein [Francisella]|uniref:hypothetical protein n=1 Tax=Francisella TaxID=262 RepID=UPI0011B4BE4C|nr:MULTISPECIES: hypothetical protein [Francisella]
MKKIYYYINNFIGSFNINILRKLWGYQILIKGSLLLISAFFAALAYMFIYSGGYYFKHQMNILNIPSSSFNSSFLDTFDLTKSIEVFASETTTKITSLILFLIIIICSYIGLITAVSYCIYNYVINTESITCKNYIGRGIAQAISTISTISLFPILIIVLLSYFPTRAEELARTDIENKIFESIKSKTEYIPLYTDNNFNYVAYPQESTICRTPLYKNYIDIKDIQKYKKDQFKMTLAPKLKQIKYNCSELGDKNFRKDICNNLKSETIANNSMEDIAYIYKMKNIYCDKETQKD